MGGIGRTLAWLPAARIFLAGAALLAATAGAEARRHSDAKAIAAPRTPSRSNSGVALPRPLDPVDATRIRRILTAQRRGNMANAFRESEQLDTSTPLGRAMLGYILADRYLSRFYRARAAELSGWLAYYADEPDAPAIHALLVKRLPRGVAAPPAPVTPKAYPPPAINPLPQEGEPEPHVDARNSQLDHAVWEHAQAGRADSAVRLIEKTKGLGASYAAQLRAEVAQALFTQNRDQPALDLADTAVRDSHGEVGLAAFVAGLAAWRLGRPEAALTFFESAANATLASPSLHSAGSFWAARAHARTRDFAGYERWMTRAADAPGTFYGLLARRALGLRIGSASRPAVPREKLGEAEIKAVAVQPEGRAAFALLQIGQAGRAESELRRLVVHAHKDAGLRRAVRLVAQAGGLPDLAAEIADLTPPPGRNPREDAGAEAPDLQPRDGFRVDPALIYAIMRQESNFDPSAVSPAGARGLMQIMPPTASSMAGDQTLDSASLHDPQINLELGQRYVLYLAQQDMVEGDLIRLLASYNAGPGRCAEWDIHDTGDPLLFLEAIPIAETRTFVRRVLAYTWAYAMQLKLPSPSLDELAAGIFPRFRDVTTLAKETAATTQPRVR
jgi:soluble lytic murein transglycosylase